MSAFPQIHDSPISDSVQTHSEQQYANAVNPHWARLLKLMQMNVHYEHCIGAELFTTEGRRILDFLSGYCVHNLGHNHPAIIDAIKDELDRRGPAMLQSHVPERAGELAERLCSLAGGSVREAFFCSSGSEGIEAAIKFARAHTDRAGLLYAEGAFHGLACGALSLMGDPFWKQGFGPLLAGVKQIPFDDLSALEEQLETREYAAFVVEEIQGEGGIRLPMPGCLRQTQALCRRRSQNENRFRFKRCSAYRAWNLPIERGRVFVDLATGAMRGGIFVDATSGKSGNAIRDGRMTRNILEAQRYADVRFSPVKLMGSIFVTGTSTVEITAKGKFIVPYVQWGMKNPSTFLLKVNQEVEIDLTASGHVNGPRTS